MKEVLLANGFQYLGYCAACGGTAEKYVKQLAGSRALVKTWEKKGTFLLTYKGVTKGFAKNLQLILENRGLATAQPV